MYQYLYGHYQKHTINYEGFPGAELQRSDITEAAALSIKSTVKPEAVANDETQSRKAADASSKSRQQPQD
jgi:hypothetical protein